MFSIPFTTPYLMKFFQKVIHYYPLFIFFKYKMIKPHHPETVPPETLLASPTREREMTVSGIIPANLPYTSRSQRVMIGYAKMAEMVGRPNERLLPGSPIMMKGAQNWGWA